MLMEYFVFKYRYSVNEVCVINKRKVSYNCYSNNFEK